MTEKLQQTKNAYENMSQEEIQEKMTLQDLGSVFSGVKTEIMTPEQQKTLRAFGKKPEKLHNLLTSNPDKAKQVIENLIQYMANEELNIKHMYNRWYGNKNSSVSFEQFTKYNPNIIYSRVINDKLSQRGYSTEPNTDNQQKIEKRKNNLQKITSKDIPRDKLYKKKYEKTQTEQTKQEVTTIQSTKSEVVYLEENIKGSKTNISNINSKKAQASDTVPYSNIFGESSNPIDVQSLQYGSKNSIESISEENTLIELPEEVYQNAEKPGYLKEYFEDYYYQNPNTVILVLRGENGPECVGCEDAKKVLQAYQKNNPDINILTINGELEYEDTTFGIIQAGAKVQSYLGTSRITGYPKIVTQNNDQELLAAGWDTKVRNNYLY